MSAFYFGFPLKKHFCCFVQCGDSEGCLQGPVPRVSCPLIFICMSSCLVLFPTCGCEWIPCTQRASRGRGRSAPTQLGLYNGQMGSQTSRSSTPCWPCLCQASSTWWHPQSHISTIHAARHCCSCFRTHSEITSILVKVTQQGKAKVSVWRSPPVLPANQKHQKYSKSCSLT